MGKIYFSSFRCNSCLLVSFLSVYGYSPSFLKFSRVVTLASTATSNNLVGENCRGRRKNISIFRDFKFVEDKSSNIFFFPPLFNVSIDRSSKINRLRTNSRDNGRFFPPSKHWKGNILGGEEVYRSNYGISIANLFRAGEAGARYRIFLVKSNRWPLSGPRFVNV